MNRAPKPEPIEKSPKSKLKNVRKIIDLLCLNGVLSTGNGFGKQTQEGNISFKVSLIWPWMALDICIYTVVTI